MFTTGYSTCKREVRITYPNHKLPFESNGSIFFNKGLFSLVLTNSTFFILFFTSSICEHETSLRSKAKLRYVGRICVEGMRIESILTLLAIVAFDVASAWFIFAVYQK